MKALLLDIPSAHLLCHELLCHEHGIALRISIPAWSTEERTYTVLCSLLCCDKASRACPFFLCHLAMPKASYVSAMLAWFSYLATHTLVHTIEPFEKAVLRATFLQESEVVLGGSESSEYRNIAVSGAELVLEAPVPHTSAFAPQQVPPLKGPSSSSSRCCTGYAWYGLNVVLMCCLYHSCGAWIRLDTSTPFHCALNCVGN